MYSSFKIFKLIFDPLLARWWVVSVKTIGPKLDFLTQETQEKLKFSYFGEVSVHWTRIQNDGINLFCTNI